MKSVIKIIALAFLLLPGAELPAQTNNGDPSSEKAGFAMVKPQPWSPPNQATILKFISYVDRSAQGTPGAGYFVFQLPNQSEKQVPSTQVVKIVTPTKIPNDITDASDLESIKKAIEYYKNVGQTFPAATQSVAEMVNPLLDVQSKFDSGLIRKNGVWESVQVYQQQSIAKIETKLVQELSENMTSQSWKSFNLYANNYYLELLEAAKTDTELAKRLEALKTRYEEKRAAGELQSTLSKINDPALESQDLSDIVLKLKRIPSPDSRVRRILEQADQANQISSLSREIKNGLELQYRNSNDTTFPTPISNDLDAKIQKIEMDVTIFKSGNPPAGISIPANDIEAEVLFSKNIPDLTNALKRRDYAKAESYAAPLLDASTRIGPKTNESMKSIYLLVTTNLANFAKLRDEADMLTQAGKNNEALAKYSEALNVMPDAQISAKIEDLKMPVSPAK